MGLAQCAAYRKTFNPGPSTGVNAADPQNARDTTTPLPKPSTGTGTATGTGTDTSPDTDPDDSTAPDPSPDAGCGTIFRGVKCALSWAFAPSQATKTRMGNLGDTWASKPPISIFKATAGAVAPLGTLDQTCPDWAVTMRGKDYALVCGNLFAKQIRDSRGILLVGMVAVAFSRLMWSIWYAGVPVIKPTRGGD